MKFILDTNNPIALSSFDFLYPSGAIRDNFKNPKFNQKLYRFPGDILDLGCAGGGFVKNCIEDNRIAVGLEGNDFNLKNQRFEWATIPENLFICDITKPFTLHTGSHAHYQFGIVTAWEVLEHILEEDLPQLFANISSHMSDNGLLIVSINNRPSPSHSNHNVDLHRTKQSQEWWLKVIHDNGFIRDEEIEKYFDKDWLRNERGTFHLVLKKK